MSTNENIRRFFSPDRVCVLTLTVSLPDDLDMPQTAFYTPLSENFANTVQERLFPLALDAYRECTDRRKRWRYTPWQAYFSLTHETDGILTLCLLSHDTVYIKESHTWKNGVITRRKRLG